MSFLSETKKEICRMPVERKCCALAEAFGVLLYGNSFSHNGIRIMTESKDFAQRLPRLFQRAFHLELDSLPDLSRKGKLQFQITDHKKIERIFDLYGYGSTYTVSHHINFALLEDSCCRTAFFRGVFLAGGFVTDPEKRYHLELLTSHSSVSRELVALLREEGFSPKETTRGANQVVYFKQSEAIEDFLTTVGAPAAATKVMMAKVEDMGISAIGLPSEKNDFKNLEPVMMSWLYEGQQKSNENAFFMTIAHLDSWDIQSEFAKEDYCLFSKYPRHRLADLVRVIDSKLEDYSKDVYNLVTVRKNKRDIVFREKITAKQLKEKNKRFTVIGTGQLVISRIGAKDGAIGIVPKELDGSIVSDNFLVLEIVSSEIDPFYLLMVLTSERYKNMLRVISRGVTDRSYIRIHDLLGLTIPMPEIEEQRKIVGDLQETQQRISKLEKKWADGINRFSKELFEQ